MRLAGHVFDSYDDINGQVLRDIFPTPAEVPDLVKTAHRLNPEEADALPDDRFALVLLDAGQKFRKYAMTDPGNITLSVHYLLKQAHLLPQDAVKAAAENLLEACAFHKLAAPLELKIAALSGISGVSGKAQYKPYAQGAKVIKVQAQPPGDPTFGPKQTAEKPMLGRVDPIDSDLQQRTNYQGTPGTNFVELPILSPKEKQMPNPVSLAKHASDAQLNAHLQLLAASPQSVAKRESMQNILPGHFQGEQSGETLTRQTSWGERSYFDVTGWDPAQATKEASAQPVRTLLDGRYPIDSYDQVEKAAQYFDDYWKQFRPTDRREYCVKLASRMEELGMHVPELVERYGAEGYAVDVDQFVNQRRGYINENFHDVLDLLLEKRASVEPKNFVEALTALDTQTGLNYFWGSKVMDPFFSVYGPSAEKVASASFTYDDNGVRVGIEDLEYLARNGKMALKRQFGMEFMERFIKNPRSVFESLPKTNKLLVARLASDRHPGTQTE